MSVIEQTIIETPPLAEPFEVESDPRREVLWRAAELIEERGWHQGWFVPDDGSLCMLRAIGTAQAERGITPTRSTPFLIGRYSELDYRWNDAPGRTKEEVVAKLRELAEGPLS